MIEVFDQILRCHCVNVLRLALKRWLHPTTSNLANLITRDSITNSRIVLHNQNSTLEEFMNYAKQLAVFVVVTVTAMCTIRFANAETVWAKKDCSVNPCVVTGSTSPP